LTFYRSLASRLPRLATQPFDEKIHRSPARHGRFEPIEEPGGRVDLIVVLAFGENRPGRTASRRKGSGKLDAGNEQNLAHRTQSDFNLALGNRGRSGPVQQLDVRFTLSAMPSLANKAGENPDCKAGSEIYPAVQNMSGQRGREWLE
jgi:hypothetical protein